METKQNLTTVNYSPGSTPRIKYIVIHFTSNNGDTAYGNTQYFKSKNRGASAHYFVDEKQIWQCVEDKNIAWHCGSKTYKHSSCRNSNAIGIELCSRISDGIYYFKDQTITNAVELVKTLMNKYCVPVENVIRHYDVTGKMCPEPFVRDCSQWNRFKNRLVQKEKIDMDELNQLRKEFEEYKKSKDEIINTMGTEIAALQSQNKEKMIYNFIDQNMPTWAHEAVQWAYDNDIIKGTGDGLNLNDAKIWTLTVLYRAIETVLRKVID